MNAQKSIKYINWRSC